MFTLYQTQIRARDGHTHTNKKFEGPVSRPYCSHCHHLGPSRPEDRTEISTPPSEDEKRASASTPSSFRFRYQTTRDPAIVAVTTSTSPSPSMSAAKMANGSSRSEETNLPSANSALCAVPRVSATAKRRSSSRSCLRPAGKRRGGGAANEEKRETGATSREGSEPQADASRIIIQAEYRMAGVEKDVACHSESPPRQPRSRVFPTEWETEKIHNYWGRKSNQMFG